ncbi:hypothetical protein JCM21900_003817 [Sporobolomyces salmonicolor]
MQQTTRPEMDRPLPASLSFNDTARPKPSLRAPASSSSTPAFVRPLDRSVYACPKLTTTASPSVPSSSSRSTLPRPFSPAGSTFTSSSSSSSAGPAPPAPFTSTTTTSSFSSFVPVNYAASFGPSAPRPTYHFSTATSAHLPPRSARFTSAGPPLSLPGMIVRDGFSFPSSGSSNRPSDPPSPPRRQTDPPLNWAPAPLPGRRARMQAGSNAAGSSMSMTAPRGAVAGRDKPRYDTPTGYNVHLQSGRGLGLVKAPRAAAGASGAEQPQPIFARRGLFANAPASGMAQERRAAVASSSGSYSNGVQVKRTEEQSRDASMKEEEDVKPPRYVSPASATSRTGQSTRAAPTGQACGPVVSSTLWEDEMTVVMAVLVEGHVVARRADNDWINCTKLLNMVGMTRGKRDMYLKNEPQRVVFRRGALHLKGVWLPLPSALRLAQEYSLLSRLYPLFEPNLKLFLFLPPNRDRTTQLVRAARGREALGAAMAEAGGGGKDVEEGEAKEPDQEDRRRRKVQLEQLLKELERGLGLRQGEGGTAAAASSSKATSPRQHSSKARELDKEEVKADLEPEETTPQVAFARLPPRRAGPAAPVPPPSPPLSEPLHTKYPAGWRAPDDRLWIDGPPSRGPPPDFADSTLSMSCDSGLASYSLASSAASPAARPTPFSLSFSAHDPRRPSLSHAYDFRAPVSWYDNRTPEESAMADYMAAARRMSCASARSSQGGGELEALVEGQVVDDFGESQSVAMSRPPVSIESRRLSAGEVRQALARGHDLSTTTAAQVAPQASQPAYGRAVSVPPSFGFNATSYAPSSGGSPPPSQSPTPEIDLSFLFGSPADSGNADSVPPQGPFEFFYAPQSTPRLAAATRMSIDSAAEVLHPALPGAGFGAGPESHVAPVRAVYDCESGEGRVGGAGGEGQGQGEGEGAAQRQTPGGYGHYPAPTAPEARFLPRISMGVSSFRQEHRRPAKRLLAELDAADATSSADYSDLPPPLPFPAASSASLAHSGGTEAGARGGEQLRNPMMRRDSLIAMLEPAVPLSSASSAGSSSAAADEYPPPPLSLAFPSPSRLTRGREEDSYVDWRSAHSRDLPRVRSPKRQRVASRKGKLEDAKETGGGGDKETRGTGVEKVSAEDRDEGVGEVEEGEQREDRSPQEGWA